MMNANKPQTPGVYTVEKSAFPNSVAEVPTAIPAFIGYTEKAVLNGKPLLISSMYEYEQHFGTSFTNKYPITVGTAVNHDFSVNGEHYSIGTPKPGNMFYLYNCLQLFFQNGGRPCYITSIGTFTKEVLGTDGRYTSQTVTPDKDDFFTGLEFLPKITFPKPTIILTPDSLLLSSQDYFTVQEQVLMQCGELKDRVALIDVYNGYKGLESDVINNFRNNIGNNFLSYGIAYYPFLETTIVETGDINYANVDQKEGLDLASIFIGESALEGLKNITTDIASVANLVVTPSMNFKNVLTELPGATAHPGTTEYPSWSVAFNAFGPGDNPAQILQFQLRVVYTMALVLYELGNNKTVANPAITITDNNLINAVQKMTIKGSYIISQILSIYPYDQNFTSGKLNVLTDANLAKIGITKTPPSIPSPYKDATSIPLTEGEEFNIASNKIKFVFTTLNKAISQVSTTANSLLSQYNGILENNNSDYKTLMTALAKRAGILPPSAAMAGVYSLIDNSEGVWISPANRNINSVVAPTVQINDDQQASLNVDALAGKSINAIRSFYGRGPAIIWGARTLDGNSQDWRYINIRRTVIMIEQSVANATQQLVFQANDASTWANCEGMISNFLHNLWADGALQGASASNAYSVSVGLGKTMTPQDILNGIMRVQVKLALIHPAEFIIITYDQEMPTS